MERANKNDFKIVEETLLSVLVKRPSPTRKNPQGVCMDKGYDYEEVRNILKMFNFIPHIRCRGEEARKIIRENGWKARMGCGKNTFVNEPFQGFAHLLDEESC